MGKKEDIKFETIWNEISEALYVLGRFYGTDSYQVIERRKKSFLEKYCIATNKDTLLVRKILGIEIYEWLPHIRKQELKYK